MRSRVSQCIKHFLNPKDFFFRKKYRYLFLIMSQNNTSYFWNFFYTIYISKRRNICLRNKISRIIKNRRILRSNDHFTQTLSSNLSKRCLTTYHSIFFFKKLYRTRHLQQPPPLTKPVTLNNCLASFIIPRRVLSASEHRQRCSKISKRRRPGEQLEHRKQKKKERKGEERNKEREKDRERKKVIVEIVPALLQLQKFPWKLLGSFPCPLAAREHGNKRFRGRVQRSRRRRAS